MRYRIAMVSDASAPLSPAYPGHGLGQAVHRSSVALAMSGHDVTVYAPQGSTESELYNLITPCQIGNYTQERQLAKAAIFAHQQKPYDVIIDHTHTKAVSYYAPNLPVLSWYHDIFMRYEAINPVMVSQGMKYLPGMEWAIDAPVCHHWVDADEYQFNDEPMYPPYALFLGIFRDYKQPVLAIQACALAGIRLIVAGTIPGGVSPFTANSMEVTYVGGVVGANKVSLYQGASVFLQLGHVESFGLTTAEAALCGTPIVAWASGGTLDLIDYKGGVKPASGVYVQSSRAQARSVADAIKYAMSLDRNAVRADMIKRVGRHQHVQGVERLIAEVV
jgi:glycosyltransferase involved in cell wall biosynthesis